MKKPKMEKGRTRKGSEKFLTGEDMRVYKLSRELTYEEMSQWLGITRSGIQQYEKRGASMIVALALAAVERGLKPWKPTAEDRLRSANSEKESNDVTEDIRTPKRRKPSASRNQSVL